MDAPRGRRGSFLPAMRAGDTVRVGTTRKRIRDMGLVGRVDSLWRYPVKSMRGEELAEAYVGFSGVDVETPSGEVLAVDDPAN
jgi:hypothetical protein